MGLREGPAGLVSRVCSGGSGLVPLVSSSICCALRLRLSSKQNFCTFLLFLLYSPTVLHATKLMRRSLGSSVFSTVLLFGLFLFLLLFV